jgi:hypothetical protein
MTERCHTCELLVQHVVAVSRGGQPNTGIGRSPQGGEREDNFRDNEGVSPNESEPDSASLRENGGGQSSRGDKACHQWGSNERKHRLGRSG